MQEVVEVNQQMTAPVKLTPQILTYFETKKMYLEVRQCYANTENIIGYFKYPLSGIIQGFQGVNTRQILHDRYGNDICSLGFKAVYQKNERVFKKPKKVIINEQYTLILKLCKIIFIQWSDGTSKTLFI